jgi:hypothetical protein
MEYYKLSEEQYNILNNEINLHNKVYIDNYNNAMSDYKLQLNSYNTYLNEKKIWDENNIGEEPTVVNKPTYPQMNNSNLKTNNIGFFNTDGNYYIKQNQIIPANISENVKSEWEEVNDLILGTDLRIFRYIDINYDPLVTDFSIVGLKKNSPVYERGRKVSANYIDLSGNIVVEKIFTDIRDLSNNRLEKLQVTFNWYTENNEIGLTKTEIVKSYNSSQAKTEERQRRGRQIDFLEAIVEGTPIEASVIAIITKYQEQITKYVQHGLSDQLNNAMINETDPSLRYVLFDIYQPILSLPEYRINTIQTIQYQIGVKTMVEIIQENASILGEILTAEASRNM